MRSSDLPATPVFPGEDGLKDPGFQIWAQYGVHFRLTRACVALKQEPAGEEGTGPISGSVTCCLFDPGPF